MFRQVVAFETAQRPFACCTFCLATPSARPTHCGSMFPSKSIFIGISPRQMACPVIGSTTSFRPATTMSGSVPTTAWYAMTVLDSDFSTARIPQLPFDEIHTLYEDTDGSIWIGTTRGVARYQLGQPARLECVPTFSGRTVHAFLRDSRGTLWIGTEDATYVSENGTVFEPLEDAPRNVRAICEDQDGTLWFGSHVGLFYREGPTYRQVVHDRLPKDAPMDEGIPTRRVNAIYCDESGDLWIGTYRTLLHMRNRPVYYAWSRARFTADLRHRANSQRRIVCGRSLRRLS